MISVLFSVTTTYILYDAYNYIGVGLSTTLHFLYPMFTVVFGFLLFKRKLGKEKIIALILATIGVAMATGNSDMFAAKGILLALLSAVTYAGYLLGIEQTSIQKMDSMKAMFYMCIINGITVFLFDLPSGNVVYGLDPKVMFYTFILAVLNSSFAYVLLIIGIKKIGAGNAFDLQHAGTCIRLSRPGVIFLQEKLPVMKLVSCIMILGAVMIPILKDRKSG